MISERLTRIRGELESVRRTRGLHRAARRRVPYPVAALVGYTNAGKSALFNQLTESRVLAKDLLFATLDPTMRAIRLPSGRKMILADTVGFVSELPTTLIAAFRATLEEVIEADIIVHVRDISHPETVCQSEDVNQVLSELGIDLEDGRGFCEVLNKIDLLDEEGRRAVTNLADRSLNKVALSALTGDNCDLFLRQLDDILAKDGTMARLSVCQADGAAISWLYRHANVVSRIDEGELAHFEVSISSDNLARFEKKHLIPSNNCGA